jgi:hypothetical protein
MTAPSPDPAAALGAAAARFLARVSHWNPDRWSRPGKAKRSPSRGALVHGLVQQIADAAADTEGQPRRPVPRLDNDLVLPDQIRVLVADLLSASAHRPTAAARQRLADTTVAIDAAADAL